MFSKIKKKILVGDSRDVKLKKNALVSLLLKGASMFISLLLVPLTLSFLTSYEYGVWLTINSILIWINYFDIGLGNGLRNKLTEAISLNNYNLAKTLISTTFCLLTIIIIVLSFVYGVINIFLDWNDILNTKENPIKDLNEIILIVFSLCCLQFVLKVVGVVFQSYQMPMVNDFIVFLGQFFSLIYIYILTLTYSSNFNFAFLTIGYALIPNLVLFVFLPYTFLKKYPQLCPSIKLIDFKYGKSLMNMGWQFFLLQIACLVLYQSSNILIARLFSPAEVTPYNISFKYINISYMIFSIVMAPLWSAITDAYVRKDFYWIKASVEKMQKLWFLSVFAVFGMLLVSNYVFYYWIGGEVYIPFSLTALLAIYNILLMWNLIFSTFSNGISQLSIQIRIAIVQATLFIPFSVFFSKWIGINGVALGLVVVSLLPAIGLYYNYKKTISNFV